MFYSDKKSEIILNKTKFLHIFYFRNNKSRAAFTLIELLIVIGILAILATVTLLVLNPAQMIKQTRDATRLSDIATILKALQVYSGSGASESTMGSSNTIYVSVPAINSNCSDLNLPTLSSGWSYACSTSVNYRKIDGTGWIPVNLGSMSYGSPLDRLPVDPVNATSTGLYYAYIKGSISLSTGLESEKYLASSAITDQGYSPYRYEAGNDITKNSHLPNCGGLPVSYQGKTYNTVQIGKQCWFQTNLDYDNGCSSKTWVDSTDVGWCGYYTGGPFANDGLLYQWSAAMNGSTSAGAQGICPTGWHIPTDEEFKILIESQATVGCESSTGWQCSPAGSHLSDYTLNHDNSSGFSSILAGYRGVTGVFYIRTSGTYIWSSVVSTGLAWRRALYSSNSAVDRTASSKAYGFSVRCLKN